MITTIKCNKDFTLNERNAVDISSESKLDENDKLIVEDCNGEKIFDVTISKLIKSNNHRDSDNKISSNIGSTIFVGEPVLDLMIDSNSGVAEYVPGGQALSQAVAFKNANPDKKVIFVGNFGSDLEGNLDENGKIVCDFLENIGIEVKKALSYGRKTRNNFVIVDDNGRTILNPVKDSERPTLSDEVAYNMVKEVISENPNIISVGVDGSLKRIINTLIAAGYCGMVEVDAGRKTLEQQLEIRDLHSIFEYYGNSNIVHENKLHIVTSKSYANMLINELALFRGSEVIEPKDGIVTSDIIRNNSVIVKFIQEYLYPYANIGITTGGCGCYFIDEDGNPNYLPSYTPNDTKGEKFKDNSAGDTFHALLLSALQAGYSTSYAYQYATIGTSIAGYGRESTAKMNTPSHEEIKRILEEENPFYDYMTEDGIVVWNIGPKRNIKDNSKIKTYAK